MSDFFSSYLTSSENKLFGEVEIDGLIPAEDLLLTGVLVPQSLGNHAGTMALSLLSFFFALVQVLSLTRTSSFRIRTRCLHYWGKFNSLVQVISSYK